VSRTVEGDVNLSLRRNAWRAGLGPAASELLTEDERWFLRQSLSTPCLDGLTSARGATLTDLDGRVIIDFHGNSVHQVGYGHPRVIAAISAAMAELPFSPRRYTNRHAVDLARRLAQLAPGGPRKVLFAPGGAEAVSMALKLARTATGRHKTLSMWDSFHGATLDAISVGGEAIFRRNIGPLLPGTEHVPPLDLAERFFGPDRPFERFADFIDYVLGSEGDFAALIAEPIRWTTVFRPPDGFWARVRESCTRHGTLLIFDEVPSGLGRTGTMFAHEQVGAVPDMLVLGKGLGGGIMPLAALIADARLDVGAEAALGHFTHEKSPVAAAAALATLDIIAEENLLERAKTVGERGRERLTEMSRRFDCLGAVRQVGAYFGLEITAASPVAAADRADAILYAALRHGLSFKVGGGNIVTLCPPLTITEAELDSAFDRLEAAVASNAG
jgi:4-aminobutyrate aminotransferase